MAEFNDPLAALGTSDQAKDTLEGYEGYKDWNGDGMSLHFTLGGGQGFKQGVMLAVTVGIAALHSRMGDLYVHTGDAKVVQALKNEFNMHGRISIEAVCTVLRDINVGVENVESSQAGAYVTKHIFCTR